jgi:hypothetical protein
MWKLVRLSLGYHLKALLVTWALCALFSKFGLAVSAIVGIVLLSAEDKERRLLLHLPLPVTRTRVGFARVVFPAMIVVLGTGAAVLLSSAILAVPISSTTLVSGGPAAAAEAAGELLFFATLVMFFMQLLLALGELNVWASGHGLGRLLIGILTLLLLLVITLPAWLVLATFGSYLVVALGTAGLTLGLMGFTVFLFELRPSFASG